MNRGLNLFCRKIKAFFVRKSVLQAKTDQAQQGALNGYTKIKRGSLLGIYRMESTMKKEVRLIKAFGKNEYGLADTPEKVSGISISRIISGEEAGCSYCFPHGYETVNSHIDNRQRSWKKQRKTSWK